MKVIYFFSILIPQQSTKSEGTGQSAPKHLVSNLMFYTQAPGAVISGQAKKKKYAHFLHAMRVTLKLGLTEACLRLIWEWECLARYSSHHSSKYAGLDLKEKRMQAYTHPFHHKHPLTQPHPQSHSLTHTYSHAHTQTHTHSTAHPHAPPPHTHIHTKSH